MSSKLTTKGKRIAGIAGVALLIGAGVVACSSGSNATAQDQNNTNSLQDRLHHNQPPPSPDFSQYLQTLVDVENAQINGTTTTTFFFPPAGSANPVKSCPSIGFAVASTAQITNPQQLQSGSGWAGVIAQMEPNGVFTGPSSGTYVVCVRPDGTKTIDYWEGDVMVEGGPAHWDPATGQIVDDGKASVIANDKKSTGH